MRHDPQQRASLGLNKDITATGSGTRPAVPAQFQPVIEFLGFDASLVMEQVDTLLAVLRGITPDTQFDEAELKRWQSCYEGVRNSTHIEAAVEWADSGVLRPKGLRDYGCHRRTPLRRFFRTKDSGRRPNFVAADSVCRS